MTKCWSTTHCVVIQSVFQMQNIENGGGVVAHYCFRYVRDAQRTSSFIAWGWKIPANDGTPSTCAGKQDGKRVLTCRYDAYNGVTFSAVCMLRCGGGQPDGVNPDESSGVARVVVSLNIHAGGKSEIRTEVKGKLWVILVSEVKEKVRRYSDNNAQKCLASLQ